MATLTPFAGHDAGRATTASSRTPSGWRSTSSSAPRPYFDGVVDFEKALADPANPLRMLPAYDSGDHLHPNDAGMTALADAVTWLDDPSLPIDRRRPPRRRRGAGDARADARKRRPSGRSSRACAREYTASTTATSSRARGRRDAHASTIPAAWPTARSRCRAAAGGRSRPRLDRARSRMGPSTIFHPGDRRQANRCAPEFTAGR